jgi:polyisoprenoid-binding protein YceI
MKKYSIKQIFATILVVLSACTMSIAQTPFQAQSVTIKLNGTSNLHDWVMNSAKGTSQAVFVVDGSDKVSSITKLNFVMPVKSLKSEHTGMDNNTYKALKEGDYKDISFVGTNAHITSIGNNSYQIKCTGKLTIAGTTKETELVATGKYNPADKSLTVTGVQKFNMTEFGVKPPTALLGSIKTGDAVSITYTLKYVR